MKKKTKNYSKGYEKKDKHIAKPEEKKKQTPSKPKEGSFLYMLPEDISAKKLHDALSFLNAEQDRKSVV